MGRERLRGARESGRTVGLGRKVGTRELDKQAGGNWTSRLEEIGLNGDNIEICYSFLSAGVERAVANAV